MAGVWLIPKEAAKPAENDVTPNLQNQKIGKGIRNGL